MIEFVSVSYSYPGAERPALDDVSISLAPGQTVALLGANGSGKSTLARLCNALILPSAGMIAVDGMDTADASLVWEIRSRVGYVQQNPENQIVGTVAEEDVAFGPENLGVPADELRRRVDEALATVGLTGLERREPHLLSEGQKQRLAIAGALAMRPAFMVLDEPTAMLDGQGRRDVLGALAVLRERGVGVLHVTHHLEDVLTADRAVVLRDGRVAFDGPPSALADDPERASGLGIDVPPMVVLAAAVRQAGVPVPSGATTAEEVAEALWPS